MVIKLKYAIIGLLIIPSILVSSCLYAWVQVNTSLGNSHGMKVEVPHLMRYDWPFFYQASSNISVAHAGDGSSRFETKLQNRNDWPLLKDTEVMIQSDNSISQFCGVGNATGGTAVALTTGSWKITGHKKLTIRDDLDLSINITNEHIHAVSESDPALFNSLRGGYSDGVGDYWHLGWGLIYGSFRDPYAYFPDSYSTFSWEQVDGPNPFFVLRGGYYEWHRFIWNDYDFLLNANVQAVNTWGNPALVHMAMLGGEDLLRGYREGRFRDKSSFVLQVKMETELGQGNVAILPEYNIVPYLLFETGRVSPGLWGITFENMPNSLCFGTFLKQNGEEVGDGWFALSNDGFQFRISYSFTWI